VALETRLRTVALKKNTDLQRVRREVAFDRFLARLFSVKKAPWILKGGYAMELRFKEARATKDIDLAWKELFRKGDGSPGQMILNELQDAAALNLKDFFVFTVGEPDEGIEAAPYGGARFPVEARMDGRLFVTFHVDIGIGDVVIEPSDETVGKDWLGFAGISSPKVKTILKEQHFAEKLHAYTQPRQIPNSRVRDLIDMVLLIQSKNMNRARVEKSLGATFKKRKTHAVPEELKPPPRDWERPFTVLAQACGLKVDLFEAFTAVSHYYDTIKDRLLSEVAKGREKTFSLSKALTHEKVWNTAKRKKTV
jgi:hypothetical protein